MWRIMGTTCFCGAMYVLFGVLALTAVAGKSATWDEPGHVVAGWLDLYQHDYRLSPDVPPIWEEWIALGMGKDGLHVDPHFLQVSPALSKQLLNHEPANDGLLLIKRAREMTIIWGVV